MGLMNRFKGKTKELVDEATSSDFVGDVRAKIDEIAMLLTPDEDVKDTVGKKAAKAAKKAQKQIPDMATGVIPGIVPKKKARRKSLWGFIWGALIAGALVYFFDSEKGEERRNQLMTTLGIEDERTARAI